MRKSTEDTYTAMNDISIEIAVAKTRLAKNWKNRKVRWSDLVKRCRNTVRTHETVADYLRAPQEEQARIKDVGGFVGGYLAGGLRKTGNVTMRSVATLDIDFGTENVWEDFTLQFDFAALLYSTHKHTPEKPRYRLVFPLSRPAAPDEYEPLCRKIAEAVGMDLFDDSTYQLARLFYWPSTSKDGEFVFECQEGPICDVDKVLAQYRNFRDASEWPVSTREGEVVKREMKKAGDPTEKEGIIGVFCRTYTIEEAIETFLSDVYEKTECPGRYTYRKGTVAAGLVCYEDKFAYANNDTDPSSRQLCNAFDLCRIHLFGERDEGARTKEAVKMPSYLAMMDFISRNEAVRMTAFREKEREAQRDFAGLVTDEDDSWKGKLGVDKRGTALSTAANVETIMENDPGLRGRMWRDDFSGFDRVEGGLPWNPRARTWGNDDDANLRLYLEKLYGIKGKDLVADSRIACFTRHRRHPIREYLKGLEWDGRERLDTLLTDYLGADDNELTRAMTRKHFTAAVARVLNPGCKYDYCLILTGPEGIGKSTLLRTMGGAWFNDSLITMEGKQGMEQAREGWIIELPELGSIKRSEVEQVKAYLSRQDDTYRPAYGRVVEHHPRQCVFCGTTNEAYFLKGETGNRRFWVVQTGEREPAKSVIKDLPGERDQLWAEAAARLKENEALWLEKAGLEKEARKRQQDFNDNTDDPLREMLADFVDYPVPVGYENWELSRRRAYYRDPDPEDRTAQSYTRRERVCPAEFICERLGKDMSDKEYKYIARRVTKMLKDMGWKGPEISRHAQGLYGRQKTLWRPEILVDKLG